MIVTTGPRGDDDRHGLVDLATLARELRQTAPPLPPAYVPGKTALRDEVMHRLGCSAERAEALVDDLERQDFIRFESAALSQRGSAPRWKFPIVGARSHTERTSS
jgi:hypothetical protein